MEWTRNLLTRQDFLDAKAKELDLIEGSLNEREWKCTIEESGIEDQRKLMEARGKELTEKELAIDSKLQELIEMERQGGIRKWVDLGNQTS